MQYPRSRSRVLYSHATLPIPPRYGGKVGVTCAIFTPDSASPSIESFDRNARPIVRVPLSGLRDSHEESQAAFELFGTPRLDLHPRKTQRVTLSREWLRFARESLREAISMSSLSRPRVKVPVRIGKCSDLPTEQAFEVGLGLGHLAFNNRRRLGGQ